MAKVDATRNYGARSSSSGAASTTSLAAAQARVEETGATFVHAFEDERVIAGQGTIGLELAEQLPELGTLVDPDRRRRARRRNRDRAARAPAGRAASSASRRRRVPVRRRHRARLHDRRGIAVKQPGELTTAILERPARRHRHGRPTSEISHAIVLLLERTKLLVEGAGAASVAALLAGQGAGGDEAVRAILSGGNIDPTLLIQVMRHGLTHAGRYLVVRTRIADRPGELIKLLAARRRGARERRLGRAPPRGDGAPDRRRPRSS